MAIFSLNQGSIGRTTHEPGAAGNHAIYITRPEACTEVIGERMPTERMALVQWLDREEQEDRKNARVIDKLIVALPIELSHEQNAQLLHEFGERMTMGRASFAAAMHDGPGDRDNPHAHIIFRDRDFETDRRVMMTTEKGSTQRFRDSWEQEVNIALERAGLEVRVDCRSLEAQGIDREPQLHVGAGAMALIERGHEFTSNEKEITRLIDGAITPVTVNYPRIDEGRTRYDENEERKLRNALRERDPADPELDWTQRGGMVAQQHAAMDWVHKSADRVEMLWMRDLTRNEPVDDDSGRLCALTEQHISHRMMERKSLLASRGQSDGVTEAWESRMPAYARAMLENDDRALEWGREGMGIER